MTQAQMDRVSAAWQDYVKTSQAKMQAEALSASTGAARDAAQQYAAVGVKVDISNLQNVANADFQVKDSAFQNAFQAAVDATNVNGAAFQAYQQANSDSLQNPGAIEYTNPNATPPLTR